MPADVFAGVDEVPTISSRPLYSDSPGTRGSNAALTSAKPGMFVRRTIRVATRAAARAPTALAGTSAAPLWIIAV